MKRLSIRRFLLALTLTILAGSTAAIADDAGPKLGLQTWTCRNMNFAQVVDFASRHGLKYLEFIPAQLSPAESKAEALRKKALLAQHGLVAYSFGVNHTSLDAAANRQLFEFARLMGMKLIIVEPADAAILDQLEALVKEYDIKIAIHNHGRGSTYGDPARVLQALDHRDPRIGVCLDVGWVTAAGFDAAKVFEEYGSQRVFDMHFKDKKEKAMGGKMVWEDTMLGQGSADYPGLFAAIRRTGWSGVMAIETDSGKFASHPDAYVTKAAEYFRKETSGGAPAR